MRQMCWLCPELENRLRNCSLQGTSTQVLLMEDQSIDNMDLQQSFDTGPTLGELPSELTVVVALKTSLQSCRFLLWKFLELLAPWAMWAVFPQATVETLADWSRGPPWVRCDMAAMKLFSRSTVAPCLSMSWRVTWSSKIRISLCCKVCAAYASESADLAHPAHPELIWYDPSLVASVHVKQLKMSFLVLKFW